jgi:hypothetical protein
VFAKHCGAAAKLEKRLGDRTMLNEENKVDKDRFEKLKETEENRGRDEAEAIDVSARQVKELREREGRSKDDE